MDKSTFYCSILSLFLILGFSFSTTAQTTLTSTEEHESRDHIYEYQDTPDYCFFRQTNPMSKMTAEQVIVIAEYRFPKFVRRYKSYLEDDILAYKEAIARWKAENEYRMDEINERAGTRK